MHSRQAPGWAPALTFFALCGSMWLIPASAAAVPKLDIKVFLGVGSTDYRTSSHVTQLNLGWLF